MQANLTWPQARALALSGSVVRRAWWLTRTIFATEGDLFWFNESTGQRVALSTDFTAEDYHANDWTDSSPDQGHCVGVVLTGRITFDAATIASGASVAATLQLAQAVDEDVTFTLTADQSSISFPSTVTVPNGSKSVDFTVAGSSTDSTSGLVNLTGTSTYITATGKILFNYIAPPLPKMMFAFSCNSSSVFKTNPPAGWWGAAPGTFDAAVLSNGSVPCAVTINSSVNNGQVLINGVTHGTEPTTDQDQQYFVNSTVILLAAHETVSIGFTKIFNSHNTGSTLNCAVTMAFQDYDASATCHLIKSCPGSLFAPVLLASSGGGGGVAAPTPPTQAPCTPSLVPLTPSWI